MTEATEVEVTQADRAACTAYICEAAVQGDPSGTLMLQAFARHRVSALTQAGASLTAAQNAGPVLLEALKALHHAVCGETGFAAAVRADSGLAYPWPALDLADELALAAIAQAQEPSNEP